MNIYQLDQDYRGYDRIYRFVVIAKDSKQARLLAASKAMDEKPSTWTEPRYSRIRKIGIEFSEKPRVVCEEGM